VQGQHPFLFIPEPITRNGRIKQTLEDPTAHGYPDGLSYGVQANGWMDEALTSSSSGSSMRLITASGFVIMIHFK
jgi:hypothetical protein